jgi:predicted permease
MALMTRLRGLLQRRRVEREIDDELASHLEMETQANIARGMAPAEARQAALSALGGVAQTKETVRSVRTVGIEPVWQDVRHASRMLASHWRFTLGAAGMLALAIGITTAMFTIVDALIIRPVPFRDPGQLARLSMLISPAVLKAWRESAAFEAVESAVTATALLEAAGTVATRTVATVTPGVFEMLGGVRPVRGRLFLATEGRAGQSDQVLVSETLWRSLYNADPALVGQSIVVDGVRLMVVGILAAEFRFPSAITELWRPTDLNRGPREKGQAFVRFAGGIPRADALRLATEAARAADPGYARLQVSVSPFAGEQDTYAGRAVPLLAGSVVLLFLVLCANVSSLLLARLTARRREFTMRAALGASRGQLLRQALVESSVLGALGLAIGAGIAWALISIARALIPQSLLTQTLNPLSLDERALVAASVFGFAATVAAGLMPAWLGTRVEAGDSLRVADHSGTEARGPRAFTRVLLVIEVALACTLLVGATLLTRSFVNLATADRGIDTAGVTMLSLSFNDTAKDAAGWKIAARTVDDELRQLPGVQQVAWSFGVPPGGGFKYGEMISDLPGARAEHKTVTQYVVSQEFFALYAIPIARGRTFDASEPFTSVIVSERLARVLWPEIDPIGRSFRVEKERWFRVIGVAREIHFPTLDPTLVDGPEFYHRYGYSNFPMVSLRCEPECPDTAVIRHRLASTHPSVKVRRAEPIDVRYAAELVRPRAAAALAVVFGSIAVIAAAGGLFSVLSYSVTRRRREFGIRTALGASPGQIRRVVIHDALMVAASGLTIGAFFAAAFARALASLQYGVAPGDPLSWSIALGVIALTTGAASWVPARAAARLDPLVLLREE